MKEKITHFGTIESIGSGKVTVRIMQTEACGSCQAAGLCQSSEKEEKVVVVFCENSSAYQKGDHVIIEGTTSQGRLAVVLAYVIPVVLIIVILALCIPSLGEASAALLSLIGVCVYYAVLATQKKRLTKSFTFEITKNN